LRDPVGRARVEALASWIQTAERLEKLRACRSSYCFFIASSKIATGTV